MKFSEQLRQLGVGPSVMCPCCLLCEYAVRKGTHGVMDGIFYWACINCDIPVNDFSIRPARWLMAVNILRTVDNDYQQQMSIL